MPFSSPFKFETPPRSTQAEDDRSQLPPYLGPKTNTVSNGLQLRADIHTLWDLGLIAIEPEVMAVAISPTLQDPSYQSLAGKCVFQPVALTSRVSHSALAQQWDVFYKHLSEDL